MRNYRIVITGSSGFLGRGLVDAFLLRGVRVLGIDQKPGSQSVPSKRVGVSDFCNILGDIRSACGDMQEFLSEVPPDERGIFHFAGLANSNICCKNPVAAYAANVNLTYHVLESCRAIGGAKFVYPSTGLVYGDFNIQPKDESDPVYASNVYAGSKLAAEMMIAAYANTFPHPAIIARLGNVYGAGGNETTVIGRILGQASRREEIVVNDKTPVRDFVFYEDVIEAFVRLFISVDTSGPSIVNISTGHGTTIGELTSIAADVFSLPDGKPQRDFNQVRKKSCIILKNEKLKRYTGWAPATGILEGLQKCRSSMSNA